MFPMDPPATMQCAHCREARLCDTASGEPEWVESWFAPVDCIHETGAMLAEREREAKGEAA